MYHNRLPFWLFDFYGSGVVIPQKLYKPKRMFSQKLKMPIFFLQKDGVVGIPLRYAAGGNVLFLRDAYEPAPLGNLRSEYCRLYVSTYALRRITSFG
jgi:hypothetical protein